MLQNPALPGGFFELAGCFSFILIECKMQVSNSFRFGGETGAEAA